MLLSSEDHLQLTLLLAPRGSAGDFWEMLISTDLMCGFACCFLLLLGCPSKRRQQERMKRWWGWAESFLLSHFQRKNVILQHRPRSLHRPGEAKKGCVQSVLLTQIWDQQRDKPGCVRHTWQAQSINKHFFKLSLKDKSLLCASLVRYLLLG